MALELTTGSMKEIKMQPILSLDATNVSIASADYGVKTCFLRNAAF